MTELQKEFESNSYTSWIDSDLYPNGKIHTQEYVEWLENKIEKMSITLRIINDYELDVTYPGFNKETGILQYFKK